MIRGLLRNTRLLGCLYIAAVPIYALIYSVVPDQFFHGNLTREADYYATVDALENKITRDYLIYVADWNNSKNSDDDGRYFGRGSLSKYFTRYDDVEISIKSISKELVVVNTTYSVVGYLPNLEELLTDNDTEKSRSFIYTDEMSLVPFILGGTPENRELGYYSLMDKDFLGPYDRGPVELAHALNTSFAPEISKALLMKNGISQRGWDNFLRMLYFSAVTITTLGYGDIAPTSDLARLLVSSEVLFGIIIIGLFLSSIPTRSK